jgi:hypothetical protein
MMQPMHFVDARAPQYATVTGVSGTFKKSFSILTDCRFG